MGVERVDYSSDEEFQQAQQMEEASWRQSEDEACAQEDARYQEYLDSLEPTFVCRKCKVECKPKLIDERMIHSDCCISLVDVYGEAQYSEGHFSKKP